MERVVHFTEFHERILSKFQASAGPRGRETCQTAHMRNVLRFVMTGLALIIAVALVLTLWTDVDASSCEVAADASPEGSPSAVKAKADAPIYVEVMSGDVKLNKRLRERVEQRIKDAFPKATIVERAARHAPKGAVGVRLTITSWAPRWTIFHAKVVESLDVFVRSADGGNRTTKGELTATCWGIVNQARLWESDADRVVEWAWNEWRLEDIHARE
jgi:hypothetical protein